MSLAFGGTSGRFSVATYASRLFPKVLASFIEGVRNEHLVPDSEFEPREGFEPGQLGGALIAKVLYSPAVARWEVERGARPLTDGSAINEQKIGSPEWLVGEILRYRGEAELLEPPDLRREIAKRARSLARELGVIRLRAPASA